MAGLNRLFRFAAPLHKDDERVVETPRYDQELRLNNDVTPARRMASGGPTMSEPLQSTAPGDEWTRLRHLTV